MWGKNRYVRKEIYSLYICCDTFHKALETSVTLLVPIHHVL
jgi:hypothetical protein